eukprot:3111138-Prymnesium_polylepis.2
MHLRRCISARCSTLWGPCTFAPPVRLVGGCQPKPWALVVCRRLDPAQDRPRDQGVEGEARVPQGRRDQGQDVRPQRGEQRARWRVQQRVCSRVAACSVRAARVQRACSARAARLQRACSPCVGLRAVRWCSSSVRVGGGARRGACTDRAAYDDPLYLGKSTLPLTAGCDGAPTDSRRGALPDGDAAAAHSLMTTACLRTQRSTMGRMRECRPRPRAECAAEAKGVCARDSLLDCFVFARVSGMLWDVWLEEGPRIAARAGDAEA